MWRSSSMQSSTVWAWLSRASWVLPVTHRRATGKVGAEKDQLAVSSQAKCCHHKALALSVDGDVGCSFWFLKPQWLSAFVSRLLYYPIIPSDTWICPAFLLKWWRALGGFLLHRQLWSLNATFYPFVTKKKKRHEARNCTLCHLLLDLFVAMSVTQMPACFIFIYSRLKCFTWVYIQSWIRQGFHGENFLCV